MNNKQVVESFLKKETGNSNNLHSDGKILKSYDMPIAEWKDGRVEFVDKTKLPSMTTRKHYAECYYQYLKIVEVVPTKNENQNL